MSRQEPPDWLLERYLLGEVTPAERARVDAAMSAELRARLDALSADTAKTLAAHPPARVAAQVKALAAGEQAPTRRWLAPALGLAAAALVALVAFPLPVGDDVRLKGDGARLALFRMTPQGPQPLSDGAAARPGDLVQARYGLDAPGFAVLLSFDALGQVTVHAPTRGADAATDAGAFTTQQAFELDATPGFERFVLFTSRQPLSVEALSGAARQAARSADARTVALAVDAATSQRSIVLVKELP
jgi:hypothetical protein